MTLNITLLARWHLAQSADFRYTSTDGRSVTGWRDFNTQKLTIVNKYSWCALVSFSGLASVGRFDVSEWLADVTAKISHEAPLSDLFLALAGGESWTSSIQNRHAARLSFSVAALDRRRPLAALISNYETFTATSETASDSFAVQHTRVRKPQIFTSGDRKSLTDQDITSLRHTLCRSTVTGKELHAALASANISAASRSSLVSPSCFTAEMAASGNATGRPHAQNPDHEYLPSFTELSRHGVKLVPKRDPDGKPLPIRLVQVAANRNPTSGTAATVYEFENAERLA